MKRKYYIIILSWFLLFGFVDAQSNKIERKIENKTIIPKGQWVLGFNTMYNHMNIDNFNLFVLNNVNAEGYNLSVSPFVLYTFKDNLSAGIKFSYDRSFAKIDSFDVEIGESSLANIKDLYHLKHTYYGVALLRQYISLGDLKRFALFSDFQLSLSGSQAKILNGKGDSLIGTYETNFSLGVGITPGVVAFITDRTATEISVGLLGVDYSITKQNTNNVETSSRSSSKGNFLINLFSIKLGMSWYI